MSSQVAYIGDRHGILAAFRDLIDAAEESIVLQMYLFAANGHQTVLLPRAGAFAYADTIADWLIAKKRRHPQLPIAVLLDTNTPDRVEKVRGEGPLVRERLSAAGIAVLNASLFKANFSARRRWLAPMNFHLEHASVNPSDWVEKQATWQFLHNVEDHRKNLVIDRGRAALLTSHNLIDAAYDWHENLFWLSGDVATQLWHTATAALGEALALPQQLGDAQRAELTALAREPAAPRASSCVPSGRPVEPYPIGAAPEPVSVLDDPSCTLVENDAIARALDELFADSGRGDTLLVASAYFSDLTRLEGLASALERGAQVRVLVDSLRSLPLPAPHAWLTRNLCNQRVLVRARALRRAHPERFQVRIFDSHAGVMMHLKSTARLGPRPRLIAGQANYTPNSFTRAWLETDIASDHPGLVDAFASHFTALWNDPASRPLRAGHARHVVGDTVRAGLLSLFAAAGLEP